jgi:hypothetical protein
VARNEKPRKTPGSATAAVGCGLVILTVSVLFVPMNLRDAGILRNRGDFVRDEFEVDYFSEGRKSTTLGGHVVSTGEFDASDETRVVWLGISAPFWLTGALPFRLGVAIARRAASK